jgi:membrane protease YdiL (CAAX protease family)
MNTKNKVFAEKISFATFSAKQWIMIAAPIALIISMYVAFQSFTAIFGFAQGYVLGFLLYWGLWCIVLPVAILKPRGVVDLFRESRPRFGKRSWLTILIISWPLVLPLAVRFVPNILNASASIIIVSIIIGITIGVTEELLWRGVYVRLFPNNIWLRYIYPSIGFGLWHLAPQSS